MRLDPRQSKLPKPLIHHPRNRLRPIPPTQKLPP
jgi:hypothetical protein